MTHFAKKHLIICDLDDTLYDESHYFSIVFEAFEIAKQVQSGSLMHSYLLIERKKSADILKDVLMGCGLFCTSNHNFLFDIYTNIKRAISLPQATLLFLHRLKKEGCTIAVLTNGVVKVQQNKVTLLGIEPLCDKIFYARDNHQGYEKPDPRCFQFVLDTFQCCASDAIVIGDHYDNDVKGGQSCGIDSLWLGGFGAVGIAKLADALPYILDTKNEKN
ncbi:HAD family hydrolase [Shewanella sp. AC91-MNA-CIBAN-0169]|uniref:HAD family hydrolase n=1 Tax=Shewanella sp. AC91-MNA-CIBAN-0169 TaxID=3140466 RepID=UPI003317253C